LSWEELDDVLLPEDDDEDDEDEDEDGGKTSWTKAEVYVYRELQMKLCSLLHAFYSWAFLPLLHPLLHPSESQFRK